MSKSKIDEQTFTALLEVASGLNGLSAILNQYRLALAPQLTSDQNERVDSNTKQVQNSIVHLIRILQENSDGK